MPNTLYYGDNLKVLREHIKDESVDLIYLDPPFNSNRSYNVLFKDESGVSSDAQITAFDDAWHWGETAQQTYEDLIHDASGDVGNMIGALHQFIGSNQMMAYLVMMTARLVELHRVLKPTGSLYLHCDPTASHYLKILLDMIFGPDNFRSDVVWKRTSGHNSAKRWGPIHDELLFFSKTSSYTWNIVFEKYNDAYINAFYRFEDSKGRYRLSDLTGAGTRAGDSGHLWKGVNPTNVQRHWAVPNKVLDVLFPEIDLNKISTQEKLDLLDSAKLIYWPPKGKVPQFKRYFNIEKGTPLQDVINDIDPLSAQASERLGYPTQKPLVLLERIIQASSNPGDVVLDPFSGCGTCISAAQKLGRQWIGIDITHLAIAMHKSRLKDMFGLEPKRDYRVIGEPEDLGGAQQLASEDRYQFQWWALSLIQARPQGGTESSKTGKKGSDRGIDGVINFLDDRKGGVKRAIVQVKSGHVNSGQIRDLKGTLEREQAAIGIFITLESSTREMDTEAATAGHYHSEIWDRDYPRIQIFSIEQLLSGVEVKLPQTPSNATAFKQAEKVTKEAPKQGKLEI
jgi:DNA modification methylase